MIGVLALIVLLTVSPDGIRQSSDPGSRLTPLWVVLLPSVVALALIRALPWKTPSLEPNISDARVIRRNVIALLVCAVAFPLVVGIAEIEGSVWYYLAKVVLLVAIPAALMWRSRRNIDLARPRVAWQWWAPVVVVAVWTILSQASPWIVVPTFPGVDMEYLIVAATLTALTAGVGEELFYRYWLQIRAEALLGRWGGIVLASFAFAIMHLGGDRQGNGILVEIAAVIIVQGSFGLMLGYLWSKYRNLALVIAAHILANGYAVFAYVIAGQISE
jgi:membrane protease YdiL (CAAX protease family)